MKIRLAVFALLVTATQAYAATTDGHDVARDMNKAVVVNTFGNCVRTKWDAPGDVCAPTPAPAPKPVARLVISKEERTVYFGFNLADITPESAATLDSLATKLKADSQIRQARVVGYADRIGSDDANQKLSEKRALAVRDYLINRGFAKMGSTETRWLGESVPATQCDEKLKRAALIECLAKDRRVEVEIDYQTQVIGQ